MSTQQFFIFIFVFGILYAIYTCHRAKTRVYCTFTRRDKTEAHKWAKARNNERIEFDGGWYYVRTKRITLEALDSGFNMLFPTMVRKLHFTYGSNLPRDPETGEYGWETPEARKNLNKREDIEALEVGSQRAFGKGGGKLAMGGSLLSIILVVGVIASLYLNFQTMGRIDMLGNAINVLQEMMMKITGG